MVSSTPAPGPSQQVPSAPVPDPSPSQPAPSASGLGQSQPAPSGSSFQIPAGLIFPSAHAASFAASYNPNANADDEKLLDNEEGAADADAEVGSESLLDADDEALGIASMDTDDHKNCPTPSEAYKKKPAVSDADAVRMAKKGAKKK